MIMLVSEKELYERGRIARDLGAKVEIVGGWAWARFATKPAQVTIDTMKAAGYHWSKAKSRWYFMGSVSTAIKRHSWSQICQRYAPVSLNEIENTAVAVA